MTPRITANGSSAIGELLSCGGTSRGCASAEPVAISNAAPRRHRCRASRCPPTRPRRQITLRSLAIAGVASVPIT
jgi:hypothetical protein